MKDLFTLSNYQKFWIALAGGVGSQLLIVCAPTATELAFVITLNEWYTLFAAALIALGVRQIANK